MYSTSVAILSDLSDEILAVNDGPMRRQERLFCFRERFDLFQFLPVKYSDPLNAIFLCTKLLVTNDAHLLICASENNCSNFFHDDLIFLTKLFQQISASDAEFGFETAGLLIYSRVDY